MADNTVKVTLTADDQATEIVRRLATAVKALDAQNRAAGDGAQKFSEGFGSLAKSTAGIDAITKRIALLGQGAQQAGTRSDALQKLITIESQLQAAVARGAGTLNERIQLEQTLGRATGAITAATRDLIPAVDAAKSGAEHFEALAKAIGGVVAALAEIRFIEFAAETIKAADEIGKLAQKTGASTESLSALSLVTRDLDISQEQLGTGLKFLSRSLSELQANSQTMAADFKAIGLSAKDLKGLTLDQAFVKIAEAQAKFGDGAGKTATILKLFGRSGSELIPLLNALANGGFDEAAKKATAMGLAISDADAKGARRFEQDLEDLKNSIKGVAFEFARGLIEPLNALIEVVTRVSENVNPTLKAFAVGAFFAATGAIALTGGLGALAVVVTALEIEVAPILLLVAALGLLGGAGAIVAKEMNDAKNAVDGLSKDPALDKALGIKEKPQVVTTDPAQEKALREARLAAVRQQAKDELAATDLGLKQTEAIESERFARGLTSLQEFYRARRQITRDGVAAQLAEIDKEKADLEKAPLPENTDAERVKRQTAINALIQQRARVEKQGGIDNLQSLEAERIAVQAIADEVAGFASQIARASGDEIGATQVEIEIQARKFEETLKRLGGLSADEIAAQGHAFTQLLTDRAAFAEQQRQADRQISDLDLQKNAINRQAQQGLISQRQATLEIAKIERDRIPALTQAADAMEAFAAETKDPALIQQAKAFRDSFAGIGVVVDEIAVQIANLGETIQSSLASGIASFLNGLPAAIQHSTAQLDGLRTALGSSQDELNQLMAGPRTDNTAARITELRQNISDLTGQVEQAKHDLPSLANDALQALAATVQSINTAITNILAQAAAKKLLSGILDQTVDTAPQVAAAAATATAAGALTTAATFIAGGAGALDSSSIALDASGASLAASGGILLSAAAALTAAAGALAAAGVASAGVLGFASGGFVRGPGSSTSDSIPARLSAGEYIIRASTVQRVGVDFLNALNFGGRMPSLRRPTVNGVPAFASGGFVSGGGSSSGSVSGEIGLHVSADEGLLVKLLGTRGGIKKLREIVSQNPRAFKADLGLA